MTSVGTYHVSAGSGPEWVCIRKFHQKPRANVRTSTREVISQNHESEGMSRVLTF